MAKLLPPQISLGRRYKREQKYPREGYLFSSLVVSAIKKPDTIFQSLIVNQMSEDEDPKKGAEHSRHVDLTDHFVKVF